VTVFLAAKYSRKLELLAFDEWARFILHLKKKQKYHVQLYQNTAVSKPDDARQVRLRPRRLVAAARKRWKVRRYRRAMWARHVEQMSPEAAVD
jgi:hypothetical protein